MMPQFIISLVWLAGFGLSYWMLKAEHETETEEWTNGDKAVQVVLSILSFLMVLIILVKAWSAQVDGYWSKPLKKSTRKAPGTKSE